MTNSFRTLAPRILALVLVAIASTVAAPASRAADGDTSVHVETPLGDFDIRLFADVAPRTVANFLDYVADGDYEATFVHRSVPGFVIQGGGYVFNDNGTIGNVRTGGPIRNEFSRSNLRGTVAMAKAAGDPDSATSQWFINLADNSGMLDSTNGGYTVFGEVVGDGMTVVDAIAALPTYTLDNGLGAVPLIDYSSTDGLVRDNMVLTTLTDTSTGPEPGSVIPPVLLRNARNHAWRSYRLEFAKGRVKVTQKGPVAITRDAGYELVSRSDFDGDLEPDALLRDTSGARPQAARGRAAGGWFLATLVGKKVTAKGKVDLTDDGDYEVVSTGDFNRDGNADVLLRSRVDDSWLLYRLSGRTVLSELELFLGTAQTDALVSTADFNDDGRADLLLRQASGAWLLYASNSSGGYTRTRPKMATSSTYTVRAVADFDRDGYPDVLLRNQKGRWRLYLLDGAGVRKRGSLRMSRDTDYTLVSHADFNGDRKPDALLRHADGSWYLYLLDGRQIVGKGSLAMSTDPDFEVASIADFNGDRKADVLLRNTATGKWMLYVVDGDAPAVVASGVPPLPTSDDWVLQRD